MKQTFGEQLSTLRKDMGYTQDEVAVRLGVTPQAVSKWENNLSCPDIMLLPELSKLYHTSIDDLFLNEKGASSSTARIPDEETMKQAGYDKMFLKAFVNSAGGDDVKVQIPIPVIQTLINIGLGIPELSNMAGLNLKQIDLKQLFHLINSGTVGELIRVDTENGDIIRIVVEEA